MAGKIRQATLSVFTMLKIWVYAIDKWPMMKGVIIAPERPLAVTVVGISLLHPAILVLFSGGLMLSYKLALIGAFVLFSIGILKGKRSAYYLLIFSALFTASVIFLNLSWQPPFFSNKIMMAQFIRLILSLIYNIAALVLLTLPKSIDFFYPEFNKEGKKVDKGESL